METIINKSIMNTQMQNMIMQSKKASWLQTLRMKASVDNEVSVFFRKTSESGQYVVHDGYSQYTKKFPDSIGYEHFCNELCFRPVEEFGSFGNMVEYILNSITQKLQKFKGRQFCIYLSLDDDDDSITVHFHTYTNELIFSSIEGFFQPVLYIIIQT